MQTVINEFKNISPEVTKAFIFKKDGEILASIEGNVEEEHAKKIADSFDEIATQAAVIGGLELVAVQGVSTQLEITSTNNSYLATVASRAADEKMVKALTRIIVPTVIKLLDQVNPSPSNQPSDAAKLAVNEAEDAVTPPEEPNRTGLRIDSSMQSSEQALPKPPVNQFMVEKIGGLLVASDVVRVDADVVAKWSELYGDREISLVNVETLEGKAAVCKFKPMKEAEGNAKGIIQIPERILQTLGTGAGKLVMVKPFIPKVKGAAS